MSRAGVGTLAALSAFAATRPTVERCELCAVALASEHEHLFDPTTRELRCSCGVCGRLLGGGTATRWMLVRHRVDRLVEFQLGDAEWDVLGLPIDLAFFVGSGATGPPTALYPSPYGAIASTLPLPAWASIVAANPVLSRLEPDVEALLVNRTGARREYYLVSIDECYRLVGLIHRHWRGFGGGPDVWDQVAGFFDGLRARSRDV
ncbi:MAG: hypothetical protein DMD89_23315 [Candidatus Rokuibacteriota bacterium]|nr:MAG: hypothetical protein DMD89_23315 [Candidatus Rokubacteria bacterium]